MIIHPEEHDETFFRVEDDWVVRADEDDSTSSRKSRLGLDEPQTVLQKLGLTLASVFVLVVILPGLTFLLAHIDNWQQPWRFIGYFAAEVVFIFLLLVVLYLWWKPPWFKQIYLAVEAKMVYLVYSIPILFVLAILTAIFLKK